MKLFNSVKILEFVKIAKVTVIVKAKLKTNGDHDLDKKTTTLLMI